MISHTRTPHTNTNTSYLTPWQLSARWEMTFVGRDGMIRRQVEHLITQSRKANLEQQFYSRSYRRIRNSIRFFPEGALQTSKPTCSLKGHLVGNSAWKISYRKGLCSEGSSEPLAFPGFSFLPKPFLETEAFTQSWKAQSEQRRLRMTLYKRSSGSEEWSDWQGSHGTLELWSHVLTPHLGRPYPG